MIDKKEYRVNETRRINYTKNNTLSIVSSSIEE